MVRTLADPDLDDGDRKLLRDVDEHGWHVIIVKEQEGTPGWAFSIGLYYKYQHPEVVVFGLPGELMHRVVNFIGSDVKGKATFEAGKEYAELLEGVRCTFKPVARKWYRPFLGYARWFYQGSAFPVLQCIWPDKQQRYPWGEGFRRDWAWAQPLLFHEEPVDARAVELLGTLGEQHDGG
jgi:hypothetical protein